MKTAPVNTAPVKSALMKTAVMKPALMKTAPVNTSAMKPAPMETAPMTTAAMAVHIRYATTDDRLDLAEMYSRCSTETRYRRFHGFLNSFPEPYFTQALEGHSDHIALVAETPTRIVALASCADAELGVLVEDAYQRQGIGTRLLTTLIDLSDYRVLKATILADQSWIISTLRRFSEIKIDIS